MVPATVDRMLEVTKPIIWPSQSTRTPPELPCTDARGCKYTQLEVTKRGQAATPCHRSDRWITQLPCGRTCFTHLVDGSIGPDDRRAPFVPDHARDHASGHVGLDRRIRLKESVSDLQQTGGEGGGGDGQQAPGTAMTID